MSQSIRTVHVIFKTHLDVGFTDFAATVLDRYVRDYFPRALDLAAAQRATGGADPFVWTTGAWLVHECLERASASERRRLDAGLAAGDIAWHALPVTTHSELLDRPMFEYGLSLSAELDRRFGRRTTAAKMTDVPGHTRAIVPLLAAAGVRFLHIGVNRASTPPAVPPVCRWRGRDGSDVIVMYQRGGYGDLVVVPGLDAALCISHTGDNHGPPNAEQVAALYRRLRRRFPEARIAASTLSAFAADLERIAPNLPVIDQEIGDTWIHGGGSDPTKIARFRELLRVRREWLAAGKLEPGSALDHAFSRPLLLVAEHTWGLDEKTHLADFQTYERKAFASARRTERFQRLEASWAEQRAYVEQAVQGLGASELGREARQRLDAITPQPPKASGARRVDARDQRFETAHFSLRFDAQTGAMCELRNRAGGRDWASLRHPLGRFAYEAFSYMDYERFKTQYVKHLDEPETAWWAVPDYSKPGIVPFARRHRVWHPQLRELHHRRTPAGDVFDLALVMPEDACRERGAPARLSLRVELPAAAPELHVTLQWFDKRACRLPEAAWFSFVPRGQAAGEWRFEKMGEWIDPVDVVRNGNRRLHAVGRGVAFEDACGRLEIDTLDAPLVAPGEPSLLNFTNRRPPRLGGVHVNLHNNLWGTNFPMWFEDDARFRFVLRARSDAPPQSP